MRNLKKILALVLALVMSFSVMTVSSAAFEDEADISADYAESIEVLSAIEVFRGDEKGNFNPKKNITRAEVAAIIYRITTGDVAGDQEGFYADLNMFSDVPADEWYAGYVNYCASAEYIKGRGDGTFDPQGKITGYDALTMILRAIGYDQNGEFTGEAYTVKVAQIAKERGITDTLKGVALGTPATREVIAEILFNTINVQQVEYTLAFGYSTYHDPLQRVNPTETLGYEMFSLWNDNHDEFIGDYADYYAGENLDRTDWGVPFYYGWFLDATGSKDVDSIYDVVLTTKTATLLYESNEAAYECDVAKAIGLTKDTTPAFITVNATGTTRCNEFDGTINLKSTKTAMGAQGRWTRIYKTVYGLEVVMMDQFLAQVNDVTEIVYDRNGHVVTPARAYITVYDKANSGSTSIVWESKKANYDYAVDEYILLYHEANLDGTIVYGGATYDLYKDLGNPETLNGKQTVIARNSDSHIVNDVEYNDAIRFYLDEAGREIGEHIWMFDTLGNLIGVVDLPEVDTNYCTISAIKWVDAYDQLEFGYALATVTYMDGTQGNLKIQQINGRELKGVAGEGADYNAVNPLVSYTTQYNDTDYIADSTKGFTNRALYAIGYTRTGGINLIPVPELEYAYTTNGVPALRVDEVVNGVALDNYYLGNTTLILTYGENPFNPTYNTYVGVKDVPSFQKTTASEYYVVDKNGDGIVEMLFIIYPVAVAANDSYNLFFSYEGDTLTVREHLYANNAWYYSITGGMVNGESAVVYTFYPAVVNAIENSKGVLLQLVDTDGDEFVDVVKVVDHVDESNYNKDFFYTADKYEYVSYGGAAQFATCADGILLINGSSYDVSDVQIIDEAGRTDLAHIVKYDRDAYLWVIYTFKSGDHNNNGYKVGVTVYVSSKSCEELVVEAAIKDVYATQNELDKATAALNQLTAATVAEYMAMGVDALIAEIETLKTELATKLATLESARAVAAAAGATNVNAVVTSVKNSAAATVAEADELVVTVTVSAEDFEIAVEAVSVVYTVEDDAAAILALAVDAVEEAVETELADLIAKFNAEIAVAAKGEIVDGECTFVVTITVGEEVIKTVEIEVAVTATLGEETAE